MMWGSCLRALAKASMARAVLPVKLINNEINKK
jgi:hypothetical protein